jgi:hypothetical protein
MKYFPWWMKVILILDNVFNLGARNLDALIHEGHLAMQTSKKHDPAIAHMMD